MSTTDRITSYQFALDHHLPDDATTIVVWTEVQGAEVLEINDTAVAREIIAATRRILEAHKAQLEAELAATERAHA